MTETMNRPAGSARPAIFDDNQLKLGLFSANASGGTTMIHGSGLKIEWDHQVSIARKADAMGFELIVPVARWRGFGDAENTNFNGTTYEAFTWAAGMAAMTERTMVFATAHVPLIHPIAAAKMATTVDHISGGRFGLNLVMGWFTPEMNMFGVDQYEHDTRYAYGKEWLEIANRLWAGDVPFDYDGEFFQLKGVEGAPTPIQPRPVLVNAGVSPTGMDFAAGEVDFLFGSPTGVEAAGELASKFRAVARDSYSREVGVITLATVFCRDTEEEARAAHEQAIENGDWDCADQAMEALHIDNASFEDHLRDFQKQFVIGFGSHAIVGSPEQVAEQLAQLSAVGVDGLLMSFVDYDAELDHFASRVMPLLREAGLRN
jgi:alkanesulfonate monooxygenase SsuD/methylene tetrahydromethanopterin reductase-like flavin-dependent oxidoreductase (luciferase family)